MCFWRASSQSHINWATFRYLPFDLAIWQCHALLVHLSSKFRNHLFSLLKNSRVHWRTSNKYRAKSYPQLKQFWDDKCSFFTKFSGDPALILVTSSRTLSCWVAFSFQTTFSCFVFGSQAIPWWLMYSFQTAHRRPSFRNLMLADLQVRESCINCHADACHYPVYLGFQPFWVLQLLDDSLPANPQFRQSDAIKHLNIRHYPVDLGFQPPFGVQLSNDCLLPDVEIRQSRVNLHPADRCCRIDLGFKLPCGVQLLHDCMLCDVEITHKDA